jgi:hypothetical protein
MPSPENSTTSVECTWIENEQQWDADRSCPSGRIPECTAESENGTSGEVKTCNCIEVPD